MDQTIVAQVVFQCSVPYCESSFEDSFSLAEHIKKHAGEKRHICPVRTCGRRFSTPGNLSRHKRLHGPIKPLECPVAGCICTFRSENKLSKHMKFHLGNHVHVCSSPGCGKTFSTAGNLNRHIKGHHPDLSKQKTMLTTTSMQLLPGFDHSYDSPSSAEELGMTNNPMMTQLRTPSSPTSSVSTVDANPDSPAPGPSCASPGSAILSLSPLAITLDSEQLDELVSILNENVKVEDTESQFIVESESLQAKVQSPCGELQQPVSVLDDMIRFHIDHLRM